MKKNRLQDPTHTRKDVFVFAIDEKDLPPSNKTAASKLTKKYMVTITFDNGEFVSVKNAFPANRDQRAVYKVLADIQAADIKEPKKLPKLPKATTSSIFVTGFAQKPLAVLRLWTMGDRRKDHR